MPAITKIKLRGLCKDNNEELNTWRNFSKALKISNLINNYIHERYLVKLCFTIVVMKYYIRLSCVATPDKMSPSTEVDSFRFRENLVINPPHRALK